MQLLKTLYLYLQNKKECVEEYSQNFRSLWDMVEAFGGSTGIHKGLVDRLLAMAGRVAGPANIMDAEQAEAENEVTEAVKAALLISRANKVSDGQLKEQLANNFLLGTDQ